MTITTDTIITLATNITVVGGATFMIIKLLKPFKKPFEKLDAKLDDLKSEVNAMKLVDEKGMEYLDNDKRRLDEHEERLHDRDEDRAMLMKALFLLVAHAETGNCTGELSDLRKEMEVYLAKKK